MIGLIAMAAAMTVGDLQTLCSGDDPTLACKLYILGIGQGVSLAATMAKDQSHICLPEDVSETELAAVVKRVATADLAKFPQDRSLDASGFVGAALLQQYPCNR